MHNATVHTHTKYIPPTPHTPPPTTQTQDYVKLATWEDRNYASMRVSIEKSQRQLHKLARQATTVLDAPAAALLAGATQKLGFDSLVTWSSGEDALVGDGQQGNGQQGDGQQDVQEMGSRGKNKDGKNKGGHGDDDDVVRGGDGGVGQGAHTHKK